MTVLGTGAHNSCVSETKKTAEGLLIGERIRRAYLITGTNRREIADKSKIGYSTLGNYEHGTRRLPVRHAQKLGSAFGLPAAYLMGLIDEDDMELLRAPRSVRQSFLGTLRALKPQPPSPPGDPQLDRPFSKPATPLDGRRARNR